MTQAIWRPRDERVPGASESAADGKPGPTLAQPGQTGATAAPMPLAPEALAEMLARNAPQPAASSQRPPAQHLGRVVGVSGCTASVIVEPQPGAKPALRAEIGSLVRIRTPGADVVGVVSGLRSIVAAGDAKSDGVIVEMNLVGDLIARPGRKMQFRRGVANFPCVGDAVTFTDSEDLTAVYVQPDLSTIEVGTVYQDSSVSGRLLADELFAKHFIITGATGCGKSSALCAILQRVLGAQSSAHVVILDIHSEYQHAFGKLAETITPENLQLPFWLLNFQELRTVLTSPDEHYDAQVEILNDAIITAKRRYSDALAGRMRAKVVDTSGMTADTPTPFRLADVLAYIEEQLGKLERSHPTLAYRKLRTRIEALTMDSRYAFMFGNSTVDDNMVDVLGRLFRVPNNGRPVTVLALATVPAEILDVVISLIARLTFNLAVWSDGSLPMLLVCEEAHRYAPADDRKGFLPTRFALSQIAKEGRKYGISLALLTQRPSELDTTILSQCGTLIAMRLSTERDQAVIRTNVHEGTFGLLEYLPLLADREAIVLGQGAPMPMRIRFHELPSTALPGKQQEGFTLRWTKPNMDRRLLEEAVTRWRGNTRPRR